jgi:hypothetical protein
MIHAFLQFMGSASDLESTGMLKILHFKENITPEHIAQNGRKNERRPDNIVLNDLGGLLDLL